MQIIQYFDDRNSSKVYLNDSSTKNFVVVVVFWYDVYIYIETMIIYKLMTRLLLNKLQPILYTEIDSFLSFFLVAYEFE